MGHGKNLFALFLLAIIITSLVQTSEGICMQLIWDLHIINGIDNDAIVVYPTSKDGEDLGPHNLNPNERCSWNFCEKFAGSIIYHAVFYWKPKQQNYTVFDDKIRYECFRRRGSEDCYWLVREDGFYMNAWDDPWPKGWVKKYDW